MIDYKRKYMGLDDFDDLIKGINFDIKMAIALVVNHENIKAIEKAAQEAFNEKLKGFNIKITLEVV